MRSFKLLKNIILSVMMLALPMGLLAQSNLKQILERGELRVGTTGDWNPMTLIDPATQKREGFDIDVATALAADMGVKVVFVPTTWKTLVNGIVADKYDMSTSASLSPKRALVAGYSKSYFAVVDVPLMNRSSAGKYNSWEDLNFSLSDRGGDHGNGPGKKSPCAVQQGQDHHRLCTGQGLPGSARRTCRCFHDE